MSSEIIKSNLLYQVRVDLDEKEASNIRENKKTQENIKFFSILKKYNAKLVCQFDAFNNFVKECENSGEINNPLYKWTKDTVQNEVKKNKYLKSFTVYVHDAQLYRKNIADEIEKEFKNLKSKNITKINKFNSDPKSNPQPPKKYF